MYASSLSKEGSRKDGTVLELRPGRIHAGGHSSYVPLRTIRFPILDGEPGDAAAAATQQQQPSPSTQRPQSPQPQSQATNGSPHLAPPAHPSLRPVGTSQPSPTQPTVVRTDSNDTGSPDAAAPAADDPALAVRHKGTSSLSDDRMSFIHRFNLIKCTIALYT